MNIRDIAKMSGVGVSTVSRVLNNHPDVKQSTREKVMEVIKETNYVPNNSARILKQNNIKNIGVLVKGVFNPFFSELINVIGNKINEENYTMILQQNDYGLEQEIEKLISFIKEKKLQGIICLGGNFTDIEEESFKNVDIPIVLTSINTVSLRGRDTYSTIGIDNFNAAYDATKALIDKGHKKIAIMLGEENDYSVSWLRYKGYSKALKEHGIEVQDENLLLGDFDTTIAYYETKKFLEKHRDITAMFAISDMMAIGVAKAITDSGFKVGEDISLIGFDGMAVSKFYNPGISTVKQPKGEMAEQSVDLLFKLMNHKSEHKHVLLDTQIIERESIADISGKHLGMLENCEKRKELNMV